MRNYLNLSGVNASRVQPPLELLCVCEHLTLAISTVLLKCFRASDMNYRDSPVGFLLQSCGSVLALNLILLPVIILHLYSYPWRIWCADCVCKWRHWMVSVPPEPLPLYSAHSKASDSELPAGRRVCHLPPGAGPVQQKSEHHPFAICWAGAELLSPSRPAEPSGSFMAPVQSSEAILRRDGLRWLFDLFQGLVSVARTHKWWWAWCLPCSCQEGYFRR